MFSQVFDNLSELIQFPKFNNQKSFLLFCHTFLPGVWKISGCSGYLFQISHKLRKIFNTSKIRGVTQSCYHCTPNTKHISWNTTGL